MSTIDDSDRRIGGRTTFDARMMVVHGGTAWFAELLDLSEGGCSIARPVECTLAEEDVVRLFFYRGDDNHAIIVAARIARMTTTQIGIEYQESQSIPPRHGPG